MRYLYLDNYRGFSKSYIPIKQVNFLVGENSTGKSSFLSIVQLLSSFRFWFDLNFNTDLVSLGTFDDIVSVSSLDRSYFRVGVVDKKEQEQHFLMLTFGKHDGQPSLSELSYSISDKVVKVIIEKNTVKYKEYSKNSSVSIIEDAEAELYLDDTTGFTRFDKLGGAAHGLPLMIVVQEINRALKLRDERFHIGQLFARNSADEAIWLAPIRTAPERIYGPIHPSYSPDGTHTPHLIKTLLTKKSTRESFRKFIEKFGVDSGLFETLDIMKYGSGDSASFELDIRLFGEMLNISTVGYGVSQSLPIVVECFAREEKSFFSIQQPEVHLHPKAQAALGDLFFFMGSEKKHMFLIETHSDYIIDRFRLNMKRDDRHLDSQILFFHQLNENNHVVPIEINKDGSLPSSQPKEYRDFFVKEEMRLLDI